MGFKGYLKHIGKNRRNFLPIVCQEFYVLFKNDKTHKGVTFRSYGDLQEHYRNQLDEHQEWAMRFLWKMYIDSGLTNYREMYRGTIYGY